MKPGGFLSCLQVASLLLRVEGLGCVVCGLQELRVLQRRRAGGNLSYSMGLSSDATVKELLSSFSRVANMSKAELGVLLGERWEVLDFHRQCKEVLFFVVFEFIGCDRLLVCYICCFLRFRVGYGVAWFGCCVVCFFLFEPDSPLRRFCCVVLLFLCSVCPSSVFCLCVWLCVCSLVYLSVFHFV